MLPGFPAHGRHHLPWSVDLTLPLTIGAGPYQSRPNPDPRVCEKSDPPLYAQGSDHFDRSIATCPDAQWPLPYTAAAGTSLTGCEELP